MIITCKNLVDSSEKGKLCLLVSEQTYNVHMRFLIMVEPRYNEPEGTSKHVRYFRKLVISGNHINVMHLIIDVTMERYRCALISRSSLYLGSVITKFFSVFIIRVIV